jgi:hypothetical protein
VRFTGRLPVTDDGTHNVFVEAGNGVNDGQPHRVVVARVAGQLWYARDGVVGSATVPDAYASGNSRR